LLSLNVTQSHGNQPDTAVPSSSLKVIYVVDIVDHFIRDVGVRIRVWDRREPDPFAIGGRSDRVRGEPIFGAASHIAGSKANSLVESIAVQTALRSSGT
jgi:hypothetical protein